MYIPRPRYSYHLSFLSLLLLAKVVERVLCAFPGISSSMEAASTESIILGFSATVLKVEASLLEAACRTSGRGPPEVLTDILDVC